MDLEQLYSLWIKWILAIVNNLIAFEKIYILNVMPMIANW